MESVTQNPAIKSSEGNLITVRIVMDWPWARLVRRDSATFKCALTAVLEQNLVSCVLPPHNPFGPERVLKVLKCSRALPNVSTETRVGCGCAHRGADSFTAQAINALKTEKLSPVRRLLGESGASFLSSADSSHDRRFHPINIYGLIPADDEPLRPAGTTPPIKSLSVMARILSLPPPNKPS